MSPNEVALYGGVAAVAVIFLLGWATRTFRMIVNPDSKFVIWCEVTMAILAGRISVNEDYEDELDEIERRQQEDDDDETI